MRKEKIEKDKRGKKKDKFRRQITSLERRKNRRGEKKARKQH